MKARFFLPSILLILAACAGAPSQDIEAQAERVASTLLAAQSTEFPDSGFPSRTPPPSPTRRPTATALPPPTPTPEVPTACSGIAITDRKTSSGIYLTVSRCEDDLQYELGPLALGAYAVGPNEEFLVYCSYDGSVYAAKIGEPKLVFLKSIKRDLNQVFLQQPGEPGLGLSFIGDYPYSVVVYVCRSGNCPLRAAETGIKITSVRIPVHISHPK